MATNFALRTLKDVQTIKRMQEAGWTFDIRGERVLLGEPGHTPLSMAVAEACAAMQRFLSRPSGPASQDYAKGYSYGKAFTNGWREADIFNSYPLEELQSLGYGLVRCEEGEEGAELMDAEGDDGRFEKMWMKQDPIWPAYISAKDRASFERGWVDGFRDSSSSIVPRRN